MNGIDVSSYQPKNITSLVDYDFAIIKATEGTGYVSPNCDAQYQAAVKRGKLVGVYHFASGGDARAEAEFFVKNIKGYLGQAVLVLDWEANAIPKGAAWVQAFVRRVKELTQVPPIIYGSASPLAQYGIPAVAKAENCGIWAAAYADYVPDYGYQKAPQLVGSVIRQWTSVGRLSGYGGNLDLNSSILTPEQWKKYAQGARGGATKPLPAPKPVPKPVRKTNEQVAAEIVAGKGGWGNGVDRVNSLKKAGYNYNTVQALVNKLLNVNKPVRTYYTVKKGDTMSGIAGKYKTTLAVLDKLNPQIKNLNEIYPGEKVRVK